MRKNVNVSNVGVDEIEYKEYCKSLGLDPEHKLSKIKYGSTKDEDVKELLDKIEKGEVDLDDIEIQTIDVKEAKKDISKGIKMIFEGISYMTGNKEKLENNPFYDLDENDRFEIAMALTKGWNDELLAIAECIHKGSMIASFKNYLKKGREKNDKKA